MFKNMIEYISESGAMAALPILRGPDDTLAPQKPSQVLVDFVLASVPAHHRFTDREGRLGIVYFDDRGRAASVVLDDVSAVELTKIATSFGYQADDPSGTTGYVPPEKES